MYTLPRSKEGANLPCLHRQGRAHATGCHRAAHRCSCDGCDGITHSDLLGTQRRRRRRRRGRRGRRGRGRGRARGRRARGRGGGFYNGPRKLFLKPSKEHTLCSRSRVRSSEQDASRSEGLDAQAYATPRKGRRHDRTKLAEERNVCSGRNGASKLSRSRRRQM